MADEKRLIELDHALQAVAEQYTTDTTERELSMFCDIRQRLRTLPTVDAVEVVHSRFVRIVDFGDGEGCFGYCERCKSIHHAQSPVALKAYYKWCRWCGAKMDGGK